MVGGVRQKQEGEKLERFLDEICMLLRIFYVLILRNETYVTSFCKMWTCVCVDTYMCATLCVEVVSVV